MSLLSNLDRRGFLTPQEMNLRLGDTRKCLELAEKIINLTNSKSKIVHKPLPKDDPKVRCPDIGRARKLLDWKPNIDLQKGLSKTVDWFKKQRQEENA